MVYTESKNVEILDLRYPMIPLKVLRSRKPVGSCTWLPGKDVLCCGQNASGQLNLFDLAKTEGLISRF